MVINVESVHDPFIKRNNRRIAVFLQLLLLVGPQSMNILNLRFKSDQRIEYTVSPDLANVNSMLRFMLTSGYAMGNGIHIVKAKVRARMVQQ